MYVNFFSVLKKYFVQKFSWDLQSFHFVFKITISKMRNLCSLNLCSFIKRAGC